MDQPSLSRWYSCCYGNVSPCSNIWIWCMFNRHARDVGQPLSCAWQCIRCLLVGLLRWCLVACLLGSFHILYTITFITWRALVNPSGQTFTHQQYLYNFQQWMSRLPQRWRTQQNAIRLTNCKFSWIIKILNAHCTARFYLMVYFSECLWIQMYRHGPLSGMMMCYKYDLICSTCLVQIDAC